MRDDVRRTILPGPNANGSAPADAAEGLSARLLGALRDHAVFALDDGGCVASWTAAAERLTGFASDDVLQRPCDIFAPADGGPGRQAALRTAADTGAWNGRSWWRRNDGRLIRVEETVHPVDGGGYVVVARDITGSESADERLVASDERLAMSHQRLADSDTREAEGLNRESLLRSELQAADRRAAFLAEASSILVTTSLDFDSTVHALARLAVSRLTEWCVIYTVDEVGALGRQHVAHRDPQLETVLADLLDDGINPDWEQSIRSVIDTGQAQLLEHAVDDSWFKPHADSEQGLLDRIGRGFVMATPLLGRGHVLGAITFVGATDGPEFTEADLLLAEELGRRAAIALDNARLFREAQDANRAKADFLAVISHELRTPLNAIMGYSDLLDAEISGDLTDKQRRQVDRIRASARHLLQLIEEILSFARIQSGGDEVRLEPVDVRGLMAEAASIAGPMAKAKGLEFRVEAPEEAFALETDSAKARQVLVNLLANAVKFTQRGSVAFRFRQELDHAVFEVADTGIGIPAEQAKRIYEPFWQAEHPNTRKAGGTGLGLSVSRRYARLLRGDLAFRSEPGSGTTFYFSLPTRTAPLRRSDRAS
jgi:PAS domain S-box-containing protein